MELKKRLASAVATGALLLNALTAPAFASTTIELSGNGSFSNNTANVNVTQNTTVVQSNTANITNNVDVDAKTGNNDANNNTGGDVSITTGNATSNVTVNNKANKNVADINCCDTGNTTVLIKDNGTHSDNEANLNLSNNTEVFQFNDANVRNYVDADAETGDNDANNNTNGNVSIKTGNAQASADVSTTANVNKAKVGDGKSGNLSLKILENGAFSDNTINLDLDNSALLVQENQADVYNWVDVDAKTGNNDANNNTGGDSSITTGNAKASVEVDNKVNFNWADLDCGCLLGDITAKIAENGTDSDNDINADLDGNQDAFQGNCVDGEWDWDWHGKDDCSLDNNLDANAKTGDNDANNNTGDGGDDPSVKTGNAESNVDVSNTANLNVLGSDPGPSFPGGVNINISIDLDDLKAWLLDLLT